MPKVLIAESTPEAADHARRCYGPQAVTAVTRLNEALRFLQADAWDLLLIDEQLGPTNTLAHIGALKESPLLRGLSIIVMSERSVESAIERAFEAGADEFLHKPLSPVEFQMRTLHCMRTKRMAEQAMKDSLTGAWNRRALSDELHRAIALTLRSNDPLTLLMLDLDGFKQLNDERGHQSGDELLRTLCEKWMAILRPYDRLYRYGGDEFLLLLPATDETAATTVVRKLKQVAIEEDTSVSCGVATWVSPLTPDELIALADAALYEEKRQRQTGNPSHA